MAKVWARLGKAELQRLIGGELLERLELLLPALSADDFHGEQIYSTEALTKIFESFCVHDLVKKPEFRRSLFNSFSPEEVDRLVKGVSPSLTGSFQEKIEALVRVGWSGSERTSKLAELLDLPSDMLPQGAVLPAADVRIVPPTQAYKPLKDYQTSVFFRATEELNAPRARFVVQMPTGSGKTRTAMEIVASTLNKSSASSTVVWLAHAEELCEQAHECFLDVWNHVGVKPLRLIRAWGTGPLPSCGDGDAMMVIGSFQKLFSRLEADSLFFEQVRSRAQLVVVDEAHKVLAPTYAAVTKGLCGPVTAVIGLTATPGRSVANDDENRALADFFFNKVVTVESGRRSVINFLRGKGVLAGAKYEPLLTHRQFALNAQEKRYLEQFFDLPKGVLSRLAEDDVRNVEIVKRLQRECDRGRQVLFFACSVDHSRFIAALLLFLGVVAAHLDGNVPRERRANLITRFRRGDIQVLCNFGVLSTGFDAPKVDCVFIARPTASIVMYSQMVGRGLRGPAIGGTEECKIIDVIDNIAGFSNQDTVYSYFDEYYSPEVL